MNTVYIVVVLDTFHPSKIEVKAYSDYWTAKAYAEENNGTLYMRDVYFPSKISQ